MTSTFDNETARSPGPELEPAADTTKAEPTGASKLESGDLSNSEPADATYNLVALTAWARSRCPYALSALPPPDAIAYQLQLGFASDDSTYFPIVLRIGTIYIGDKQVVVLVACTCTGAVEFYYEMEAKEDEVEGEIILLSKADKKQISFFSPWYHVKTANGRSREICALAVWYLMHSPIEEKLLLFRPCGTHKLKDFELACRKMAKSVMRVKGIHPDNDLQGEDFFAWQMDELHDGDDTDDAPVGGAAELVDVGTQGATGYEMATEADTMPSLFNEVCGLAGMGTVEVQDIRKRWVDEFEVL